MSDVPLLSVIVPAYNAAGFVRDAIGCIQQQGYPKLEVIIVDDGSTDATREVVAACPGDVQYVHQENQGVASARNHGLCLARGSFISFLDADDIWTPGALKLLAQHLHDHVQTGVVLGRVQYTRLLTDRVGNHHMKAFGDPCVSFNLGAGLFRKQVFERVGVFDTNLHSSEDVDWFMRAREAAIRIELLDEAILLYRRHGQNLTQDRAASHRDLARALKQSLDRRRRSCAASSLPSLATQQSTAGPQNI